MKLKKIIRTLYSFFAIMLFTGCSGFLDTELNGEYTSATFYQTEDHAILAINASYQIASFTSTNNNLWVFGDVASDDAVKGGNDGDQSDIAFVDNFNVNPDNGTVESFWKHYYEGISRTNNVIYFVPDIDMDVDLKERIIGEAKFLRAYFYFHLSNIFGEIPLKTEPVFSREKLNVARSTIEQINDQMETDLLAAIAVLPSSYNTPELGRATKGAALGLLSKVYLFQEKWELALDAVNQVQALSYDLMPVYSHNFDRLYENNMESVFEIQHLTGQVPSLGSYINQWFSPSVVNGYFFDAPTKNFVDEFEVSDDMFVDPRLDYSVGRAGNKWVDGKEFLPEWSPASGFLQKKQVQAVDDNPIGDGDLNYTFMRFAEILLIKAEALNELSRGDEALIPLNKIRKRSRESYLFDEDLPGFGTIPSGLLPDIIDNNTTILREAIRHERRVELGLEFHRFYDLMRYGKSYAEQALSSEGFNYDVHRYFPIPQSELDTNTEI